MLKRSEMNQRKSLFALLCTIYLPVFLAAQGEVGSIGLRTQSEIGFSFADFDVPEIGDLRSVNEGFYQIQLDETVYLQVSRIFSVGLGVGLGWYNTREINFFSGFFEESNASAFHLRTSINTRFAIPFSDKIGMYHEVQFRYQLGQFERLSPFDGAQISGDINILGLGYNPIVYYKISDRFHLEGAIHGISFFRTRTQPDLNDDFFINLDIHARVRMGIQVGFAYYFPVEDEEKPRKRKRRKRRR
jgi:hypothetical protein